MPHNLTISLTDQLYEKLRKESFRRRKPMAEIVRETWLEHWEPKRTRRPARKVPLCPECQQPGLSRGPSHDESCSMWQEG